MLLLLELILNVFLELIVGGIIELCGHSRIVCWVVIIALVAVAGWVAWLLLA